MWSLEELYCEILMDEEELQKRVLTEALVAQLNIEQILEIVNASMYTTVSAMSQEEREKTWDTCLFEEPGPNPFSVDKEG